jgi:uncharacterized iron-regulated protein
MNMRNGLGLVALAGVVGFAAATSAAEPAADVPEIVAAARAADIVILGEIHDNPTHHATQAAVVAALRPAALVFEMIPQARESEVNALREEGAGRQAIADALDWSETGWPDFAHYAAILEAAPAARVFGAGQSREDVRRAVAEGAATAFGPDAATYGLDRPLADGDRAAREADMQDAHCGELPPEMLAGMVEAQRFRDAGLADAALWARTMTGDGQVVVIAGSGHADRARGVPAALAVADPELTVLSVGQFEGEPGAPGDYDLVLLAPAPERDDPCATLDPPQE